MTKDYGGIINELVAGRWKHPRTGQAVTINIHSIVIKETIDGMEGQLIYPLHQNEKLGVVSDTHTHEALGRRVAAAIRSEGLAIEAQLLLSETTGTETQFSFDLNGHKLTVANQGRFDIPANTTYRLGVDVDKAHFFEQGSGERIDGSG